MRAPIVAAAVVVAALTLAGCSAENSSPNSTAPARHWSQADYLARLHAEGLHTLTPVNVDHFSRVNCDQLRADEKVDRKKGAILSVLALGEVAHSSSSAAAQVLTETVTTEYCPDLTASIVTAFDH